MQHEGSVPGVRCHGCSPRRPGQRDRDCDLHQENGHCQGFDCPLVCYVYLNLDFNQFDRVYLFLLLQGDDCHCFCDRRVSPSAALRAHGFGRFRPQFEVAEQVGGMASVPTGPGKAFFLLLSLSPVFSRR